MSTQRMQRRVSAGSEESCRNSCRTIHKMLCGGVTYASLVPDTAPIAMAGHFCSVRWRNIARKWRSIVQSLAADWWKRKPPVKSICTSSSSRSGGTSGLSVMATHCVSRFDRRRVEAMRSSNLNSIVRSARWEYEKGERKLPLFFCLLNLLHLLPRATLHTEVAVRCCLPIDGAAQVEPLDNRAGTEVEVLVYNLGEIFAVAVVGFYHHRFRAADGVGDGHEHLFPVAIRDEVLGGEAAHICGGAVDFHRFLARKAPATVRHEATICIDLYFPAGQARIGHEASLYETAGRIDEYLYLRDVAEYRLEHMLDESRAHLLELYVFGMLCGRERRNDSCAVAYRHLRLTVGAKPWERTIAAYLFEPARERVRENDAFGQILECLVGRIAVHDALIASAAGIDTLRDVWGLLCDAHEYLELIGVADVSVNLTADCFKINFCFRLDLAADHQRPVTSKALDASAALWILPKHFIEYCI